MKTVAKVAGGVVMTLTIVSLMVAILVVFKWDEGLVPRATSYLIAAGYGFVFGLGLAFGGFWMTTGSFRSDSGTLRTAAVIVAVISSAVVFWTYALMVAGIHELGHPVWASLILAATVVGLIVWAVRHQIEYGSRAANAIDAHPLSTVDALRDGATFRLRGRVALGAGAELRGPLSGRRCAVLNLDVLETSDPEIGAMIVAQLERGTDFTLRTDAGEVRIDATRFMAGYLERNQHTGALDPEHVEVRRALGRPAEGILTGRELSIVEDDTIDVLGLARRVDGTWWLCPFDETPLAIRLVSGA